MSDQPILELQDVFVLSGIPQHTFVQPVEYTRLLVALRTPGRSVVVEGPSGIGKTTAVVNAISEAGIASRVFLFPRERKTISSLFTSYHTSCHLALSLLTTSIVLTMRQNERSQIS